MSLEFCSVLNSNFRIPKNSVIIADKNVWEIYQNNFLSQERRGTWLADQGELTKDLNSFKRCVEYLAEVGVDRQTVIIAIGGGALSDFAGFVASVFLRGLNWQVIPTTLLSMIDAAIGGKTALNLESGKNLIGSFHLPEKIYIDPTFLESLAPEEFESGCGELLKYGLLSKEIYQAVVAGEKLVELIKMCSAFKQEIVHKDFNDKNLRKILNLGHTFGHAFEKSLSLPHGTAVVWGIEFINIYFLEKKLSSEIENLKLSLNINTVLDFNKISQFKTQVLSYLSTDKKREDGKINLVLISDIGEPFGRVVSFEEVENILENL